MATFEVPDEVLEEFEGSLSKDIETWSQALENHIEKYEEGEIEKANSRGVMIAAFVPPEIADELAIDGGEEPDDMHLTLFYFGKEEELTTGQIDTIKKLVADCAKEYAPMQGAIGGSARFPASGTSNAMDVLIRLVDIPRLEGFRERLLTKLTTAQVVPRRDHGYTPHVTLAYVGTDYEGEDVHPEPVPFAITELTVSVGDERYSYTLTGEAVVKSSFSEDFSVVKGVGPTVGGVHANRPMGEEDEDEEEISVAATGEISKLDTDKRLVFGWASVIEVDGKQITDRQGDRVSEDELEAMAYRYVLECRKAGEMHAKTTGIGRLVESIVLTKEKQKALGIHLGRIGWWVGFKIDDDDTWKQVKSGKFRQFSIHGRGIRQKVKE